MATATSLTFSSFKSPFRLFKPDDRDPLYLAAFNGDIVAVRARLLCCKNGDVNKRETAFGRTALFCAVDGNHDECVIALLAAAADPNIGAYFGLTPLMVAIFHQNDKMVDLLLRYHANANAKTITGVTPLWCSTSPAISNMLLQNKANIHEKHCDVLLLDYFTFKVDQTPNDIAMDVFYARHF